MRFAVLALCLTGCLIEDSGGYDDDYYYEGDSGWGSGWGGGGGTGGYGCQSDSACGTGYVCTRSGECLPPSLVRVARTIWTVNDQTASIVACMRSPKLSITFTSGAGEEFGFTPVPCEAGKFTVDKLPTRFTGVTLTRQGEYTGGGYGTFNTDGTATLDLPY